MRFTIFHALIVLVAVLYLTNLNLHQASGATRLGTHITKKE